MSGSVIVVTQKGILNKLVNAYVPHSQIKPRYITFLFLTVKCWLQKRGTELVMQGEEEKKLHWVYAIIFYNGNILANCVGLSMNPFKVMCNVGEDRVQESSKSLAIYWKVVLTKN